MLRVSLCVAALFTVSSALALRPQAGKGHTKTSDTAVLGVPATPMPRCCHGPCKAGTSKYYSIAHDPFTGHWHCGESCIKPSSYWLYHIFEKNLTLSSSPSPCASFGYSKYNHTEVDGVPPIAVTVDFFDCVENCITQPPSAAGNRV